jgi:hypothetical protein
MTLIIGMINGTTSLVTIYLTSLFFDLAGDEFIILLSLTSLISVTISSLPEYITTLVVGYNSIKRVQPFLLSQNALLIRSIKNPHSDPYDDASTTIYDHHLLENENSF